MLKFYVSIKVFEKIYLFFLKKKKTTSILCTSSRKGKNFKTNEALIQCVIKKNSVGIFKRIL